MKKYLLFGLLFLATFGSFAISYPIQINSNFTLSSVNQFDLKQTESASTLASRMKHIMQFSELFPTGLTVTAGSTLQLNVSRLAGSDTQYGKVVITTRYKGGQSGTSTQTINLTAGINNINVTVTGNVFVAYTSSNADPGRQVRYLFNSGFSALPFFIKANTTTTEWLDMLQNYPATADVMFAFKRGVMVLDRTRIETYKNNDFEALTDALDRIIDEELRHSGIITTSNLTDKNRDFANLLYITTNDPGLDQDNPHATSPGLIRVPIDWVAAPEHILNNTDAWGISHEIGHHIQQNAWDWGKNTEVQVNIGTMAARKMLYPSVNGLDNNNWLRALRFVNGTASSYDNSSLDLKAKIPLFWQLQLAFGVDFFQRFYSYVRENAVVSGSSSQEKLNFMKTANTIAGKNLIDYFTVWGMELSTSQASTLNAMGLSKPGILPQTFAESNLIENLSLLQDTIVFQGQTVNYKVAAAAINGVKKVEFYNGSTKIGESTGFPFQLTISPNFGVNPISAKLIDANDQTVLIGNTMNITVNRAKIISPLNNANFPTGTDITIASQIAVVPGNAIQKVTFYSNEIKLGEVSSAPYQWVLQNQHRGTQRLKVIVYYQNGETSTSTEVNIAVGGVFAEADTYVRDGSYKDSNYGTEDKLTVKKDGAGYYREAYLRFNLADLNELSFGKAVLRLNEIRTNTNVTGNGNKWRLYAIADDTWDELSLKYSNRPNAGTLLAEVTPIKLSGTPAIPVAMEWDITSYLNAELTGDKKISFVLTGGDINNGTGDADFASKEHANLALRPLLQLYTNQEVLPVNLLEFDASAVGNRVKLTWSTASERNNSHFELEKSVDGKQFTFFTRVNGKVNAETKSTYSTYDEKPAQITYYRLFQVDLDGKRTQLGEKAVSFALKEDTRVNVYPNPASTLLSVQVAGYNGKALISIIDLTGKIVSQTNEQIRQDAAVQLSVSNLVKGIYFVEVNGLGFKQTSKFAVK